MRATTQPDLLAYALTARGLGLSVCPPKEDGTKAPLGVWIDQEQRYGWEPLQQEGASEAQIRRWYGSSRRRTGFGLITGRVSGNAQLFEFDCRATYDQFVEVAHA